MSSVSRTHTQHTGNTEGYDYSMNQYSNGDVALLTPPKIHSELGVHHVLTQTHARTWE